MKKVNKYLFLGLTMGALTLGSTSCDDFEEINQNPSTAGVEVVKPYYALNQSIVQAQQDPHIQERIFVYNWASAARIAGEMNFLNLGRYSDDYNNDYLNGYIAKWIKNATLAITLSDQVADKLNSEHDINFNANVKAFARIWRANLIAEFTDNFGPYPLDAFQGVNPNFNSVEEVYMFILKELKEATADILVSERATEDEAKSDPIFGYDAEKWQKYGNSLRMRLAMRLSQVAPAVAKAEFEDAAKGPSITSNADVARVKEEDQWSAWAGVYSRGWDDIVLSSTMSNILTGLGGIPVAEQQPYLKDFVKDINYLGLKYEDHYAENTDNPTKQFWLDGVPENLDPRALVYFCMSNDTIATNFVDKGSKEKHAEYVLLADKKDGKTQNKEDIKIDAQFTWNGYPVGQRGAWSEKFKNNQVASNAYATCPILGLQYVKSKNHRVWFGAWETHFLKAEAALYGWSVGVSAEAAYEAGIRASFAYLHNEKTKNEINDFVDRYLQSEEYNRVGTSVKFTHTAEPTSFTANYVDGYTKEAKTMQYQYPDASKILYKGHKLNDQLTKIITQKYIAQTPYGALEMWNDHRRLGLPFFDIPANEATLTGTDMELSWNPSTYKTGQKFDVYPQRMRYPSDLKNADPVGWDKAMQLLGGENTTITPLWWAIH